MVNNMSFCGTLAEVLPQQQVIGRNGKSYILKKIIIEEYNTRGDTMQSIVISLPESFDMTKVGRMVGHFVKASLHFSVVRGKNYMFMNINCTKLMPLEKELLALTQIAYTPKKSPIKPPEKPLPHKQVDEDGYEARYNS